MFPVVSPFGPTWCEAVAKGAKLRHVRTDLDFHGFVSGPTSAQHDQLRPRQRNLGPSWAKLGLGAKLGPTQANFADSM